MAWTKWLENEATCMVCILCSQAWSHRSLHAHVLCGEGLIMYVPPYPVWISMGTSVLPMFYIENLVIYVCPCFSHKLGHKCACLTYMENTVCNAYPMWRSLNICVLPCPVWKNVVMYVLLCPTWRSWPHTFSVCWAMYMLLYPIFHFS